MRFDRSSEELVDRFEIGAHLAVVVPARHLFSHEGVQRLEWRARAQGPEQIDAMLARGITQDGNNDGF